MNRETIFSPDRKRRYSLWRDWSGNVDFFEGSNDGERGRDTFVQFIGLNPSTANEKDDDPTIRRCVRFAQSWGFGALCMTNLFSMVTADPKRLVIGDADVFNMDVILTIARSADLVICCWGNFKAARVAGDHVKTFLVYTGQNNVRHLGLNQNGSPKHPLYLRGDTVPQSFIKS